ncbi:MAG: PAS domain S-box protein [Candidatus Anammoxibacter sp.]
MRIGQKLSLSFLVFALLIGIIGYVSLLQLKIIEKPFKNDIPNSIEKLSETSHLDGLAQFIRYYDEVLTQSARNYAFTQNKKWEQRYRDVEPKLDKIIKEAIRKGEPKDKEFFLSVDVSNLSLVEMEYKSIKYVNNGEKEKAIEILESDEYWKIKKIYEQGLKNYVDRRGAKYEEALKVSTKILQQVTEKTQDLVKKSEGFTLIIFAIAIILLTVLSLVISRSISIPIKKLVRIIQNVSSDKFDVEINVDQEKSRDEIGQLADSFNMMTDKLMVSRDELINAKDYIGNIIKTMADTLIVVSPDAAIKTVNQAALNLLGYREDELIGKPVGMIFVKEEKEEELLKSSGIEDLIKKGFISGVEKTLLSKDGIKIPVLFSGSVMHDEQGNVQGIVCVAQDITEHKQAQQALQESEIKFRSLTQAAGDAIISTDNRARIISWNNGAQTIFGYKEEEVLGKQIKVLIPERFRDAHEKGFKRINLTGKSDIIGKTVELQGLRKDGREFPAELSVATWVIMKRRYFSCIVRNITKRKELEQALASEKEQLAVTLQSIGDGVVATDNKGNVVMVNKAAQELTGWTQEEASGKPLSEVFHIVNEKTMKVIETPVEKVLETGLIVEIADDTVLIARDGTMRIIADRAAPILDKEDNIIGAVLVFRNVTQSKRQEEERQDMQLKMMQSSKLASLGGVVTGVAHEINQPLTYISTFLQNIRIDIEDKIKIDETKLDKRAKTAYNEVKRINNIIQHLRTFGRQDDIEMCPISIETVFNNTLLLMGERIRLRNINLIKSIEPGLPMVLGNANRLEEVFINLFQNAVDAFDKRSKSAEIRFEVSLCDYKGSLMIKVKDNGTGIEKEALDKIFEPFFTTKEVGTGLGLAIVYGTIQEHKGTIVCESEVGKGAAFTITLPVEKT